MPPTQAQPQDVPNTSQDPVPQAGQDPKDLTQDELAAALGYITTLGTQHHQAMQATMAPQGQETGDTATPEAKPQEDLTPRLDDLEGQFKGLKDDVSKEIKSGLDDVKKMIADALTQDE